VPATSFCEYTDSSPKVAHWFALDESRPLFAFAGIWRSWTGARGTKEERKALAEKTGSEEQEHQLFAFLTTEANEVERPKSSSIMVAATNTAPRSLSRFSSSKKARNSRKCGCVSSIGAL
jgi:hypothetical protein